MIPIVTKEQLEILDHLKGMLTVEDLKWLNYHFPDARWDICREESWNQNNAKGKIASHERITEILYAKKRRAGYHQYSDDLLFEEILEIAKMIGIEGTICLMRKRVIIEMILKKIREEKQK